MNLWKLIVEAYERFATRPATSEEDLAAPVEEQFELEAVGPPTQPGEGGAGSDLVIDFGTSATVAFVHQGAITAPQYLIGESEAFPSDVVLKSPELDQVLSVGSDAYGAFLRDQHGAQFFPSLKRHIDIVARVTAEGEDDQVADRLASNVSQYLDMAIGEQYGRLNDSHRLGEQSRVIVSVPNSFSPRAVRVIRNGVGASVRKLPRRSTTILRNDQLVHGPAQAAAPQSDLSIQIVREGEAVAHLFLDSITFNHLDFAWRVLKTPGQDPVPPEQEMVFDRTQWTNRPSFRVVIFDVGAGTTDLTMCDVSGTRCTVVMNAGVPIGGTDVDSLLLGTSAYDQNYWATQPGQKRFQALAVVRQGKEEGSPGFEKMRQQLTGLSFATAALRSPSEWQHAFNDGIAKLVDLSVRALLRLVADLPPVDAVLLTGRASQLPEIRNAVAQTIGTDTWILTAGAPYDLKRAVSIGCAVTPSVRRTIGELPGFTFGRRLAVRRGLEKEDFAAVDAMAPVASDAPVLWRILLLHPPEAEVYNYYFIEQRVAPSAGMSMKDRSALEMIGLLRLIATKIVRADGGHGQQPMYLAWDPDSDAYFYIASGAGVCRWEAQPPALERGTNPLTQLPIGFPHEAELDNA